MDQFPEGKIKIVQGRGIPIRGDNIDTDDIFPGRFLKALSFEKAAERLFYDKCFTSEGKLKDHPLNDKRHEGARIFVVNSNFGCGSGRAQALQAILRRGFRALAGESFAELFINNCTMNGVPAVSVPHKDVEEIMRSIEKDPGIELQIDLERNIVICGQTAYNFSMPGAYHKLLITGTWNISESLKAHIPEIHARAKKLPYLNGFR